MYNKTGRGGRKMILVNTDYITGKEFEMLGLVKGSTIQSKMEARNLATQRMVKEAEAVGADAVVNIRYVSASVMQGAAEVLAYGTAVKFI